MKQAWETAVHFSTQNAPDRGLEISLLTSMQVSIQRSRPSFNDAENRTTGNKVWVGIHVVYQTFIPVATYIYLMKTAGLSWLLDSFFNLVVVFALIFHFLMVYLANIVNFPRNWKSIIAVFLYPILFTSLSISKSGFNGYLVYLSDTGLNIYLAINFSGIIIIIFGPVIETIFNNFRGGRGVFKAIISGIHGGGEKISSFELWKPVLIFIVPVVLLGAFLSVLQIMLICRAVDGWRIALNIILFIVQVCASTYTYFFYMLRGSVFG
jgi:hypothetical protein